MTRVRRRVRPPARTVPVLLLVVSSVALGGTAAAYWTGPGEGPGSASTGTAEAVVLTPATPSAELYPGQRADVVLTASNPGAGPAVIGSLRLDPARGDGGFAVDDAHRGCATSALSLADQTDGGSGWTVPGSDGAEDGRLSITLHDALVMSVDAASACQGASFTVYLAAGS